MQVPSKVWLERGGLVLKTPEAEDDEGMRVLLSTPSITRYVSHLHKQWTLEDVVARRENQLKAQETSESFVLYMHVKEKPKDAEHREDAEEEAEETLRLIGTTGFVRTDPQRRWGMFGILLDPNYHRRGLCTLAHLVALEYSFESLGLEEAEFNTLAANEPMNAFFKKNGFTLRSVGGDWDPTAQNYFVTKREWPEVKQNLQSHWEKYANPLH
ncbi:hypothetical protein QOT17_007364 [Balamuthia mandrillaris]